MARPAPPVDLSEGDLAALKRLSARRTTAQSLALRARVALSATDGRPNRAICETVGVSANTVTKWRRRFALARLDGLLDELRPGAPRRIGDDEIAEPVRRRLEETPLG